ncbi:MAG: flavin reductase family protein [Chloroflexota bacterium]|nr:flavin reductase family protein [Chloroflexota bacterium]MDE2921052.1 flavin reductase family protein [Chloroflexota bacterium]
MTPEATDAPHALEIFKEAMASLASGVAVVTAVDPESGPCGMTVTSIASYSASPPSVIVCVDETTRSFRGMTEGDYFAVHLLSEDQPEVARLFASKVDNKFEQCESVPGPHGLQLVAGGLATLICRRSFVTKHGDHAIVIGTVVDGNVEDRQPLVYWRREFSGRR